MSEKKEKAPEKIKDRMVWVRLPDALNQRFIRQCKRLSVGDGTLARMAIVKFVEEEESKERELARNKS
jgi:hypothetical protein